MENCPNCGAPCKTDWSGLELVENTGDETLATKSYTFDNNMFIEAYHLVVALTLTHPDSNILPFIKEAQKIIKQHHERK